MGFFDELGDGEKGGFFDLPKAAAPQPEIPEQKPREMSPEAQALPPMVGGLAGEGGETLPPAAADAMGVSTGRTVAEGAQGFFTALPQALNVVKQSMHAANVAAANFAADAGLDIANAGQILTGKEQIPSSMGPIVGEAFFKTLTGKSRAKQKAESMKAIDELQKKIDAAKPKDLTPAGNVGWDLALVAERMIPAVTVGVATKDPYAGLAVMYPDVYGQKYNEMIKKGYDPETADLHGKVTGTIEVATELLPMKYLLKTVGWSGLRKILDYTVAEGTSESVSSLLQSAWDKGTINPNLTLAEALKNAGYEGLLGALAGPIVAGPVVVVDKVRAKRERKKLDEELKALLRKAELERLRGPQLPDVVEAVRQEMKKAEEALGKVAKENVEVPTEPITNTSIDAYDGVSDIQDLPTSEAILQQVELKTPDQKGVVPVKQYDWETSGPVAIANDVYYEDRARVFADEAARAPQGSALRAGMESRAQYFKQLSEAERVLLEKAQGLLSDLVPNYLPGQKIIVSTTHLGDTLAGWGVTPIRKETGTNGRHLSLAHGVTFIELNLENLTDPEGNLREGVLSDVVTHEFGHAVLINQFRKFPEHIKKALVNLWYKRMQSFADGKMTVEDYLDRREAPFISKHIKEKYPDLLQATVKQAIKNPDYVFSFNEFLANEFAKAAAGNKVINDAVTKQFKEVGEELKKLHHSLEEQFLAFEGYQEFLTWLAARNEFYDFWNQEHGAKEQTVEAEAGEISKETVGNVARGLAKLAPDKAESEFTPEEMEADIDTYNQGLRYTLTLAQLQQLNPHIKGLQDYVELVREWWGEKNSWENKANERIKQWQSLGSAREERFNKFMLDLTVKSFEAGKRFTPHSEEFQELARKYDMDGEMLALYDLVEQDFREALDAMETAQVEYAQKEFRENPLELQNELERIHKEFNELRDKNFFPLARFGRYFLRVIAMENQVIDGKKYKIGDTISFETFEKKKARRKREAALRGGKRYKVEVGKLSEVEQLFAGLPGQFIDSVKKQLNLDEEQRSALEKLLLDLHPAESFKKHMKNRKNVPGFSQDALRGYANYFMHFGNHLARTKFRWQMEDAMREVRDSANEIRRRTGDATSRDEILDHLRRHFEYIMNPTNELANLRALGFLWYLGFVPKSAVVNLTQVPLVTYPYLAARYGDARAVKALAKAMKTAGDYWRKPQKLTPGQYAMVDELVRVGILDESIATEVAAVSEGSSLQRLLPGTFLHSEKAAKAIRTGAQAGAWMFQQAEKVNRRVTAFAAYDLAIQEGLGHEAAVRKAREAVERTQFEYARWNRPEFMRGKKSVFFLFWMYKQHALFFLFNDPGKWRYLLMMFFVAGLSGLPFAEDIMDLFNYLAKKTNGWLGEEKVTTNIELETRQLIAKIGADPDLVMHGLGSQLGGLFDISGSLSMGRIVPGIEALAGREGDFNARLAKGIEETAGPVPAMGFNLMRAIADDNPNTLKRFEKAMPAFIRNPMKAYRYASQGKETVAGEATIAEFDITNPYQAAEILGQAAGFAPHRVNTAKEKYYMTQEMLQYYELRKRRLLQLLDFSIETKDRKLEEQVWKDIHKYNNSVPFFFQKLTGENIKRSRKQRIRKRSTIEQGFFTPFKGQQLQEEVDKGFTEEEVLK